MLNTEKKGEWFQITTPKEWEGRTLDSIFRELWDSPKKLIHKFRMENKVLVNGSLPNWNKALTWGDNLLLHLFEKEYPLITPTFIPIDILYEDDHLMIVNKPAHMDTHPNDMETDTHTLVNAAAFHLLGQGEGRNIRQIHRLDRDTSGAILFAKHALAGAILDRMLEKKEIKRTYIALVHGVFSKRKGLISDPIGRDRHHPTRRRVSKTGQEAVTNYSVLKADKKKQQTIVKCWLDTGRTHQIRVHMSHIGHPLVGDVLYGGDSILGRQALHSAKLEFIHPFTQETIQIYAPYKDQPVIFSEEDIYSV